MTELPLGADGYLEMDSVPDTDVDESETVDLFVEPDPVPDAVWSRMLSTAVTDTDADVDDLVPPPGAAGPDDPYPADAGYDAGYDEPADAGAAHGVDDGADAHDRHEDPGTNGGHDSGHDVSGHDVSGHDGGWHDGSW